jgi:hypothetical protein
MSDQRLALTLWPEWAWAIAHRGKDIENRTWEPPRHLIGRWLAIHAGKHIGGRPGDKALLEGLEDLLEMAEEAGAEIPVFSDLIPQIATSAVVAVVKVRGSIHGEAKGWYGGPQAYNGRNEVVNNYGWQFDNIMALPTPVPCKGAQGLWPLPDEVVQAVRKQLYEPCSGCCNCKAGVLPALKIITSATNYYLPSLRFGIVPIGFFFCFQE